MIINEKSIISKVDKLDQVLCKGCDNQIRILHVLDLKKKLKPIIRKYSSGLKKPGRIESKIFDVAIDYLVDELNWREVRSKGLEGSYVKF